MSTVPRDEDQLAQAGGGGRYQVDARGAEGVLVGDQGTQINYFVYRGTWTDGVAAPPLVSMSGTITSPYRGLSSFGERDAALFFGRESASADVLEAMSRRLEGTGLLVVSGVSGAGKSSLVRAGVLPRLRGAGLGAAPEAASWPCLVFTPGSQPLDELAVRVAPAAGADAAAVRRELAAGPAGFALTARQAALAHPDAADGDGLPDRAGQQRILLVVDQFEQLFTQCESEDERLKFITALHAAAAATGDRRAPAAIVVVLVRADFEARLADYPVLTPAVQDRYLLTAMTERQLRMAITQPAITVGASVDADLVQVLLDEVRTRSGAPGAASGGAIGAGVLPLLSHALDQAWRSRAGQALTLADYERTGGIEGAVAGSAQRAYEDLTPAQKVVAQQVFIRLTATSSDGVDTVNRALKAELTEGKDPAEIRDVEAVLEAFTSERLLTLAADHVEISHEILLTAWPLLHDTWLAETHADRIVLTRLHNVTAEWARHSRDASYLYGGSLLQAADETAARIRADPARYAPLTQTERDFLQASKQRRVLRRRLLSGAVAVLVVASLVAASVFFFLQQTAVSQERIAQSQAMAAEATNLLPTDGPLAMLLSLQAYERAPTPQAESALIQASQQPLDYLVVAGLWIRNVAFSANGRTFAAGDARDSRGHIGLWDVATGQRDATLAEGSPVGSVAFSRDGILAAGDASGHIGLWDVATRRRIATLAAGGTVWNVAFSPDGQILAAGDASGHIGLWDVATRRRITTLTLAGGDIVRSVAFSPDGHTLAAGDDGGQVGLWDVATARRIATLTFAEGDTVSGVAFSPDGHTLAVGDNSGHIGLWDVPTGRRAATLAEGSPVASVAFSPDGHTLAVGDNSGHIGLWDVPTGRRAATLAEGGTVYGVAFSPDGHTLAASDFSGDVALWDVATAQRAVSLAEGNSVSSAAFSPDGHTLAAGDYGGQVGLWDVATGRRDATLAEGGGIVSSVAFSPDGHTLAAGDNGGHIGLWDVATGRRNATLAAGGPVGSVAFSRDGILAVGGASGHIGLWDVATGRRIATLTLAEGGFVSSVAFSPDGHTLAVGDYGGQVGLWDVATGRRDATLAEGGPVNGVAFSPDGHTLAVGDNYVHIGLWDVATARRAATLTERSGVYSVAFSPDGQTLVTGDYVGNVGIWNAANGHQFANLAEGSTVSSLAFSPHGQVLALGGMNGNIVLLWQNLTNLTQRLFMHLICGKVRGNMTQAQWAQYASGQAYQKTCPYNGAAFSV